MERALGWVTFTFVSYLPRYPTDLPSASAALNLRLGHVKLVSPSVKPVFKFNVPQGADSVPQMLMR